MSLCIGNLMECSYLLRQAVRAFFEAGDFFEVGLAF